MKYIFKTTLLLLVIVSLNYEQIHSNLVTKLATLLAWFEKYQV